MQRCKSCGAENREGASFCAKCGKSLVIIAPVQQAQRVLTHVPQPSHNQNVSGGGQYGSSRIIDKLRDPGEKAAFVWLTICAVPFWIAIFVYTVGTLGLGLLVIGLIVLMKFLAELFVAATIKTNAIEVTEAQFPEIHSAVVRCCQKLGIVPPTVYVMQDSVWNAWAARIAGKRMVVLLSGALDSLLLKGDMKQVAFLVGHEIGHHAAGHLNFWTRGAEMGCWVPWILLWYKRRCELTCDRIGLFCAEDARASLLALANMTVGAQLADQVNIDQAIYQWQKHKHEIYVRYRTIYSTHPHHLWRMEEMVKSAQVLSVLT